MDLEKTIKASAAVAGIVGAAPIFASVWMCARVLTLPLPYRFYEAIDGFLYSEYQKYISVYFHSCTGVKFIFHGDRPTEAENVLYLSNHQCTVDWFVVNILASPLGLIGRIKYILKDSLRYLPLYGWYFEQHGCVYVSKRWDQDKAAMQASFNAIQKRNEKIWLVLFPEGTRFDVKNEKSIIKNHLFATSRDLPILHHVLLPRTKGFLGCVNGLRSHFNAVYDVTVAYTTTTTTLPPPPPPPLTTATTATTETTETGTAATAMTTTTQYERPSAPSMADLMTCRYKEIHVQITRINIENLPQDDDELSNWLLNRYVLKEKMLSDFYNGVSLPGETWEVKTNTKSDLIRAAVWTSIFALVFGTQIGRRLYVAQLVVGGVGGIAVMKLTSLCRRWLYSS